MVMIQILIRESNFFAVATLAPVSRTNSYSDVHRDSLRVLAMRFPFIACHRNPGNCCRPLDPINWVDVSCRLEKATNCILNKQRNHTFRQVEKIIVTRLFSACALH